MRLTREANAQARQLFERAIELDPGFAGAYAWLAQTYREDWIAQISQDPQTLERAFEVGQKAVTLDDSLPLAHSALGNIYLFKKQHEQAIAEEKRAIALDPNYADAYAILGTILNFAGRPQEVVELVEKAMRLDPHYPVRNLFIVGSAYRLMGQYEQAIAICKRALARNPDYLASHLVLAMSYSEIGREKEAGAEVAQILRISPNFSAEIFKQRLPFKDPAESERAIAALQKAGLK